MASSKVMATASTANPDLPCQQPPICSSFSSILADLQNQHEENPGDPSSSLPNPQSLGSMNMDDLLKNIYATPPPPELVPFSAGGAPMAREGSKSVEEVWKEIVAGGGDQRRGGAGEEEMTLEDFLTKAGAVREEDVRGYENNNTSIIINDDDNNNNKINNNNSSSNNQVVMVGPGGGGGGGGGGGRGKRRMIEEPPLDKATQQKQRRMIKNRESAARSRERKQAYTVELESLVTQLEEENARLVREEAEQNKERFKQLMQNIIPIVEKSKPPRVLRRVNSVNW